MSGFERNVPQRGRRGRGGRGRARNTFQASGTTSIRSTNPQANRTTMSRTSEPGTANSETPTASFFQGSQNVGISGGRFIEGGSHLNYIFNRPHAVYLDPTPDRLVGNESPYPLCESPVNEVSPETRDAPAPVSYTQPTINYDARGPIPPVQKSCDIYYRHIAAKGRGSPLWIPQTNDQLPIEYRRIGTQIGDIGIITTFGGFDFLFNIFLPAGHIMQSEVLPQGFKPLDPPRPADVHGRVEFDENSYLASSSIQRSQRDSDATGLTFKSSDSEGAVLAMPHGLISKELSNVALARQYLQDHLEDIYCYANGALGREVKNGDVCLVIGCDKTNVWGIATFARSTSEQELRLRFKAMDTGGSGGSGGIKYRWEHSGMAADVRSGPSTREIVQLRRHPDSNPFEHENQCLFIRTLNSLLGDDIWKRLEASKFGTLDVRKSFASGNETMSWETNMPYSTSPTNSSNFDNRANNTSGLTSSRSHASVQISQVEVALALHPSKHINNYLLRQNPTARMAITEDINWINVLHKNEGVLPPPDSMLKRILQSHDITVQNDIVYLLAKSTNLIHTSEGNSDLVPHSTEGHTIRYKFSSPRVRVIPYNTEDDFQENPTHIRENQSKFAVFHRRMVSSSMSTTSTELTSSSASSMPSTTGTATSWSSSPSLLPPPIEFSFKSQHVAQATIKPLLNSRTPGIDETATTHAASASRDNFIPNGTVSPSLIGRPQLAVQTHISDRTIPSKTISSIWDVGTEKTATSATSSFWSMSTPDATAFTSLPMLLPPLSIHEYLSTTRVAPPTKNTARMPPKMTRSPAVPTRTMAPPDLRDLKHWPALGKRPLAEGSQAPSQSQLHWPPLPPPDPVNPSASPRKSHKKKWVAIPREELQAAADAVQRTQLRQASSSSNLRFPLHHASRQAPRSSASQTSATTTTGGRRKGHA